MAVTLAIAGIQSGLALFSQRGGSSSARPTFKSYFENRTSIPDKVWTLQNATPMIKKQHPTDQKIWVDEHNFFFW